MAWNKPSTENQQQKPTAKTPSAHRGIIAGAVIVVALGALCLYLFTNGEATSPSPQKRDRGRIKEVKPAPAPKIQAEPIKKEEKPKPVPYWLQSDTNGFNSSMIKKWKFYHTPPARYTNTVYRTRPKPYYAIFPTRVENEIANLITIQPGETLVGPSIYPSSLEAEFVKSLETPIVISDEDTPEQKQLKQAMIATKEEINQRMMKGEGLSKILTEAREEAVRMAILRKDIETQMREVIKETANSSADIDDALAAANKILEDKGILPIRLNPITKRGMMRRLGIEESNNE